MKLILKCLKYLLLPAVISLAGCEDDDTGLPVNNAPIPRILDFEPANAGPGSVLVIKGMNFSPDISKNEVKFNQAVVPIELASESEIQVKVPDLNLKQVGVSVRSNGKISNKKILSLAQAKRFGDDFERPDFGPAGSDADPNPFGEGWNITLGRFALTGGKVATKEGGFESLMFYEPEGMDMVTGDGNFFKMTADMQGSAGSFAGIIFNAQPDRKRFYLLRVNGTLVQFLKTGTSGLNDWARVVFSEDIAGFAADIPLRIEVSSSNPGQFLLKVTNTATNSQLLDRTVTDENPYSGGVPGFYYFGLANPVNIWYDNLEVEIQ